MNARVLDRTMLYTVAIFLAAWVLVPFYLIAISAFTPQAKIFDYPKPFVPTSLSTETMQFFLDARGVLPSVINSLVVATFTIIFGLALGTPAGYALARFRFAGRRTFLHIVVAMQMFAPVVLLIAAFQLMNRLGLLNTYWGLILMDATTTLPFAIWMLTGYFTTIPREIEEAAILDKAGRWRRLADHFVPLAMPGIVTVFVFTFIISWNEFLFALTFISDDTKRPLTVGLYGFVGRFATQWNFLMAGAALATLPVLALFLVIQRRLVSGLTAGAVK
jgi:multiple sugar transport system permease protein